MFQGMKDRLAKPGATIDLFNNLATEDRDLYLVGQCQHLIFEEVDTPDVVFQSLLAWLNNRIILKDTAPSPAAQKDANKDDASREDTSKSDKADADKSSDKKSIDGKSKN